MNNENNNPNDSTSVGTSVGWMLYICGICIAIGWLMVCIITGIIPIAPEKETDFQSKLPFIHVASYSALAIIGGFLAREQLRTYNDSHDMSEHTYSIANWTITISECISVFLLVTGIEYTRGKSLEDSLILSVIVLFLLVTSCTVSTLLENRRQSRETHLPDPVSVCEEHTDLPLKEPDSSPLQEEPASPLIRFTLKGYKIRLCLGTILLSVILASVIAMFNIGEKPGELETTIAGIIILLISASIVAKITELLDLSKLSENQKIDLGIAVSVGLGAMCAFGLLYRDITPVGFVIFCVMYSVYNLLAVRIVHKFLTKNHKEDMKETTN